MSFIFQACEFLILILLFGWLTHWLYKKKKRWWALLTLFCAIANTAALVNPNSYATSESATEETATKEHSTDSSSKEKQSKEVEKKKEEARQKEEAAKKVQQRKEQEKEEQQKKEAQKKAAAKKAAEQKAAEQKEKAQVIDLPQYNGNPYVEINNNNPYFPQSDLNTHSFEKYNALDQLGRCGVAYANISRSTMPTGKRQPIGSVKPSGWHTVRYSNVDGKYLYNRCHLIGYQLTAENANDRNLITGTRYLNVEGMLPFENMVADYIKATNHHVLYRVTPHFAGDNLVASGVQIEAKSVEDNGKGILFNVYCFNVQPGVEIDYANGNSQLTDPNAEELGTTRHQSSTVQSTETSMTTPATGGEVRGNRRSKIYHLPGQRDYENMAIHQTL